MKISWYVDDLKISHVNLKAVGKIVNWLDRLYPGVTATHVEIHDYLCMTFDSSMPGGVKVFIDDYIDKVLTGSSGESFETASSPVGDHLFKVCDEDKRKVPPDEQGSNHVVVQLLFAAF